MQVLPHGMQELLRIGRHNLSGQRKHSGRGETAPAHAGTGASGREPGGCPPGPCIALAQTRRRCQTVTGRSPLASQILDVSVRA
jgi:hypothetical protein